MSTKKQKPAIDGDEFKNYLKWFEKNYPEDFSVFNDQIIYDEFYNY